MFAYRFFRVVCKHGATLCAAETFARVEFLQPPSSPAPNPWMHPSASRWKASDGVKLTHFSLIPNWRIVGHERFHRNRSADWIMVMTNSWTESGYEAAGWNTVRIWNETHGKLYIVRAKRGFISRSTELYSRYYEEKRKGILPDEFVHCSRSRELWFFRYFSVRVLKIIW